MFQDRRNIGHTNWWHFFSSFQVALYIGFRCTNVSEYEDLITKAIQGGPKKRLPKLI